MIANFTRSLNLVSDPTVLMPTLGRCPMNHKAPLFQRIVRYLLDRLDPQPERFRLEQKRRARTTIESCALTDALNYIEGRKLPGTDIHSLAELSQAIYESALNNFMALYGGQSMIILSEADQFCIDHQQEHGRIVLQPADPLAVITLSR